MKSKIETFKEYTLILNQTEKELLCGLLQNPGNDWPRDMRDLAKNMFEELNPPDCMPNSFRNYKEHGGLPT